MKLSVNWLKDYLPDLNINIEDLVRDITLKIAEVEDNYSIGAHLNQIIVAKVLESEPHPTADRLSLVTIQLKDRAEQVVCGATNFKLGDMVAYAPLGSKLPGGITIKKAKIRGIVSYGMLCSEQELEISDDGAGLFIIEPLAEVGQSLAEIYPDQVDYIIDLDNKSITHRPDLWGHYGFARELAAIFELKPPKLSFYHDWVIDSTQKPLIDLVIEHPELVYKIVCQGGVNLKVVDSPIFMQHRLFRVGLRPINNLVDVTNYIMLDLGQPMHMFDAAKISSKKMQIAMPKVTTKFISLYSSELELTSKDLAFFEDDKVVSLCGIIGGQNSEVDASTTDIFLEAGNWQPSMVRKTAIRLGLRTEAVQRYEKSLDPELTLYAIDKAWHLLSLSCPELKLSGGTFVYDQKFYNPITIDYSPSFCSKRLGLDIPKSNQKSILQRLGFKVIPQKDDNWQVEVPSWRATKDINLAEDLVEEIGRVFGYSLITPKAPLFPVAKSQQARVFSYQRQIKKFLVHSGFYEIYNNPIVDPKYENFLFPKLKDNIQILNPALADQSHLKSSLLPDFLIALASNQRNEKSFKLFELAKVYRAANDLLTEAKKLILGQSFTTKSDLDKIYAEFVSNMHGLGLSLGLGSFEFKKSSDKIDIAYPLLQADILCQNISIGKIFVLHHKTNSFFDLTASVILADIQLDKWLNLEAPKIKYKKISKFPPVYFDISLNISENEDYGQITSEIYRISPMIVEIKFLDRFKLSDGKISLTVQILFRSQDKTFSAEEVKDLQNKVMNELEKKGLFSQKSGAKF